MKPCEEQSRFQRLHADLHDLCQPLTALQCRLEIGRMLGQDMALREAVDGALEETQRMFVAVTRMRESLQRVEAASR
ncbi:MAG: hypothetical protein HIU91_00695 [Acidobacteria bacterium]|nr:hypothetical protein [Acidobacteriota bacterium]